MKTSHRLCCFFTLISFLFVSLVSFLFFSSPSSANPCDPFLASGDQRARIENEKLLIQESQTGSPDDQKQALGQLADWAATNQALDHLIKIYVQSDDKEMKQIAFSVLTWLATKRQFKKYRFLVATFAVQVLDNETDMPDSGFSPFFRIATHFFIKYVFSLQ